MIRKSWAGYDHPYLKIYTRWENPKAAHTVFSRNRKDHSTQLTSKDWLNVLLNEGVPMDKSNQEQIISKAMQCPSIFRSIAQIWCHLLTAGLSWKSACPLPGDCYTNPHSPVCESQGIKDMPLLCVALLSLDAFGRGVCTDARITGRACTLACELLSR